MQPPGRPAPFRTPLGAETPGAGHVVAAGGMKSSIVNGALVKWLVNAVGVVVSVQRDDSGGEVRLTSSCCRQAYGVPAWLTWRVCAGSAVRSPRTPSQRP